MEKLKKYYIDYSKAIGEDFSEYEFNEQGLPLVRFSRAADWQHNPVTISQYALYNFNRYLNSNNEQEKKLFCKLADWLVHHAEPGANESRVWYYHVDIPFYQLKKPWLSAMAQGQALSALCRAWQLTGDERYLNPARKSFPIFSIPVEEGGIMRNYPDGSLSFEEYPSTPPSYVLNGLIFALFGLYDFYLADNNDLAYELFKKATVGLKENIAWYDTGFWSFYDLMPPVRLASKRYHRLHILLLQNLSEITGEHLFSEVAERWNHYLKQPACHVRWFMSRIKERMFA